MLYNCSQIELQPYTIHSRQNPKVQKESQWYTALLPLSINESGIPYHTTQQFFQFSLLHVRGSWVIAYKAHGRMTGRGSGRHASSAGGHELLDARALFREEVSKD